MLVALMAQKAEVKYDPAYIMPSQIANYITAMGFEAKVLDDEVHGQNTVEVHVSVIPCDSIITENTTLDKQILITRCIKLSVCGFDMKYMHPIICICYCNYIVALYASSCLKMVIFVNLCSIIYVRGALIS